MDTLRKYDIGTRITLDLGEDLSGATDIKLIYRKPNGDTSTWPVEIDSENSNKIYYITQENDLDTVGEWRLQAWVQFGTEEWYSEIVKIAVDRILQKIQ